MSRVDGRGQVPDIFPLTEMDCLRLHHQQGQKDCKPHDPPLFIQHFDSELLSKGYKYNPTERSAGSVKKQKSGKDLKKTPHVVDECVWLSSVSKSELLNSPYLLPV